MQLVQQRGVFDVPDVRNGEPWDLKKVVKPSTKKVLPQFCQSTLKIIFEVEVIERVGPLDKTRENNAYDEDDKNHEIMRDNINNEAGEDDEIPDTDDMDPDMDYNV